VGKTVQGSDEVGGGRIINGKPFRVKCSRTHVLLEAQNGTINFVVKELDVGRLS